jgi:hypothetical protein
MGMRGARGALPRALLLFYSVAGFTQTAFEPAAAWYFIFLSIVFRPAGRKTIDKNKKSAVCAIIAARK